MNAIILAGGKSSRFGRNKAFLRFGNQLLIEKTISVLASIFCRVYIVSNNSADYPHLKAELVEDIFPGCGPMGGIHAGLTATDCQFNFITACDLLGLDPELIQDLQQESKGFDLAVPKFQGKLQMLFAFYSKNCLPVIEDQLSLQNLRLRDLIGKVNSKVIEFKEFGRSFININTQDDYQKAAVLI